MTRFRIPGPLTCDEISQALPAYFQDQLEDLELQGRIEGHLRSCVACAERGAQVFEDLQALGNIARVLAPPFPHQLPIPIVQQEVGDITSENSVLARAIREGLVVADLDQALRKRLSQWGAALKDTIGPAVKLIKKLHHPVELVTQELGEMGLIPEQPMAWPCQFEIAGSRVQGQIYVREPDSPESGLGHVQINMQGKRLTLNVLGIPLDQTPPIVMLIPLQKIDAPLIKELVRPDPSRSELSAHFTNVEDQDYLLAIEPIDDPEVN